MKNKILLLFVIILVSACSKKPTSTFRKIDYKGNGEVITLPLPEFAVPNTICLKAAHFDGKDYLYFYNAPKYQILLYDLENQELINVIQMKKEGPHGIIGFKGFTLLEKDRIMVSSINRKLYTINPSGEVINIIDYSKVSQNGEYSRAVSLSHKMYNDIYRIGNKYIIPQEPPYRDEDKAINSNSSKIGKSLFLTVENNSQQFSDQKLTQRVIEGLLQNSSLHMTTICTDKHLFWSFSERMDIYYTPLEGSADISIKDFSFPGERNMNDMQSLGMFGYYARSTLCRALLYDQYLNKFYRMVRYGVKNPDEMYGQDEPFVARYPVKFSIFVMDKDLKPEKEVRFEGTKYDFDRFFISSDGFYLSLNNPENPEFDEDFLRFERIEL